MGLFSRLKRTFGPGRNDADIREELQFHLDQLNLSAMSRQIQATIADAAAKNLSAPAAIGWLADMSRCH